MHTPWLFLAIAAKTPTGFTWQWQKVADPTLTSRHFDFYFDCVADARANGYTGPLPPGPKVALRGLPDMPAPAKALSTLTRPSSTRSRPAALAMKRQPKAEIGKRKPVRSGVR